MQFKLTVTFNTIEELNFVFSMHRRFSPDVMFIRNQSDPNDLVLCSNNPTAITKACAYLEELHKEYEEVPFMAEDLYDKELHKEINEEQHIQ